MSPTMFFFFLFLHFMSWMCTQIQAKTFHCLQMKRGINIPRFVLFGLVIPQQIWQLKDYRQAEQVTTQECLQLSTIFFSEKFSLKNNTIKIIVASYQNKNSIELLRWASGRIIIL